MIRLNNNDEQTSLMVPQVEADKAQTASQSSISRDAAAHALAEAEGASQVAAWEAKSLREELEELRGRSEALASALEEARSRESSALKAAQDRVSGELHDLQEAVDAAEAAKERAEQGVSLMKEKKKRDLQVCCTYVSRVNYSSCVEC